MPIKRCLKKVLLINLVNPYMLATKICKEEEENVDSDPEMEMGALPYYFPWPENLDS